MKPYSQGEQASPILCCMLKNEDSVLKSAMDFFRQSAVNFFGINTRITAPAETEIKDIKINRNIFNSCIIKLKEYLNMRFNNVRKL